MTVDPMLTPGRRIYEQARVLRRAKRRYLLRKVIRVPAQAGVVLQFPDNKEVTDAHPFNEA